MATCHYVEVGGKADQMPSGDSVRQCAYYASFLTLGLDPMHPQSVSLGAGVKGFLFSWVSITSMQCRLDSYLCVQLGVPRVCHLSHHDLGKRWIVFGSLH